MTGKEKFTASRDSFTQFYDEVYGQAVQETRSLGAVGSEMVWAKQEAGDWSDAGSPDLVISVALRGYGAATIDVGGGRFSTSAVAKNDFVVLPPRFATTFLMETSHAIRFVVLPYARLRALIGDDHGLPEDGDFGVLHRSLVQDREVTFLLDRLWQEAASGRPHGLLWAEGALLQMSACLLRLRDGERSNSNGALAPWRLRRIKNLLTDQLGSDVGLTALAAEVGLSPTHLCRSFKLSTGLTPQGWLLRKRVDRAQELLLDDRLSLTDIAQQLGYSGQSTFGVAFRRLVGTTPSTWRRERIQ